MENYIVRLRNLSVGYNGKPIIHDINVDITPGDIVTLIGPNGAGKSTILKSITRQLRLVAGDVYVQGKDLNAISYRELSSRLAVMLTDRIRPELMTCWDVVATGRFPYTGRLGLLSAEDHRIVERSMTEVHALELREQNFNEISDGQKQRVLLARAICQEPEIMILDEPTSFLDIRHKLDLLGILRRMTREKGITVIMSLHEIDLAQKVSDKVLCVKGDVIAGYGTPEEVFREQAIKALYAIDSGSFDPLYGSVELPRVEGEPQVFVISNCGRGIPVYRKLQQQGIPFAAGILYENDLDCRLAERLAVQVVTEEPFVPIGDEAVARALALVERCGRVIAAGPRIGPGNRRLEEVLAAAEAAGKLERVE